MGKQHTTYITGRPGISCGAPRWVDVSWKGQSSKVSFRIASVILESVPVLASRNDIDASSCPSSPRPRPSPSHRRCDLTPCYLHHWKRTQVLVARLLAHEPGLPSPELSPRQAIPGHSGHPSVDPSVGKPLETEKLAVQKWLCSSDAQKVREVPLGALNPSGAELATAGCDESRLTNRMLPLRQPNFFSVMGRPPITSSWITSSGEPSL